MGRRKRRSGGRHSASGRSGRVTPRGTRPEDRPRFPHMPAYDPTRYRLDLLMEDAEYVVEQYMNESDLDDVDRWASYVQSEVCSRAAPGGLPAPVVLSHAASSGGPAGAVLAAAIAVYGPADHCGRARRTVERINADSGASGEAPDWIATLGGVEPVRAARLADEWDEHAAVDIDFRRRDATTHRLRIGIHPFRAGIAHPISFTAGDQSAEPADAALSGLRSQEISLADARAVAERGLDVLEELLNDIDEDELDDDDDLRFTRDLFAMTSQRISMLPAGGKAPTPPDPSAEEISAPIGDFAARPPGYGEDAEGLSSLLSSLIGFVVGCWDRDPLRWTPPRVEAFVERWLPEHSYYCNECRELHGHAPDEEWLPTARSAFVRWLRFAAARGGMSDDAREANLASARRSFERLERMLARYEARF